MPHPPERTEPILRKHARQVSHDAGPGSWEEQTVVEATDDGQALIVLVVLPLKTPTPRADPCPSDRPQRGHPCDCALDILWHLAHHPGLNYTEVLDAMEAIGHGRNTAGDNLRVLVQRGLVLHPKKGGPYHVSNPSRVRQIFVGQTGLGR